MPTGKSSTDEARELLTGTLASNIYDVLVSSSEEDTKGERNHLQARQYYELFVAIFLFAGSAS